MEKTQLRLRVAGLNVSVVSLIPENRLRAQAKDYLFDFSGEPDIKTEFSLEFLKKRAAESPSLSLAECEYIWTGYDFAKKLLKFNGFVLHASAVSFKNRAYLFSAPSGTGKSTHVGLWQNAFPGEAVILNDDKPALRRLGDEICVFGTPWSGKTDKNENICVPLGGICFIERAKENKIEKADKKEAIYLLLSQIMRYPSKEYMEKLLSFIGSNLRLAPVFKMGCNISPDAAITAYNYMSKHLKGTDFYEN